MVHIKKNLKKKKTTTQATDREKIFARETSNKGLLIQKIQRTLKTQQEENEQLNLKMGKRHKDTSPKRIYRWQIKHMKKSLTCH